MIFLDEQNGVLKIRHVHQTAIAGVIAATLAAMLTALFFGGGSTNWGIFAAISITMWVVLIGLGDLLVTHLIIDTGSQHLHLRRYLLGFVPMLCFHQTVELRMVDPDRPAFSGVIRTWLVQALGMEGLMGNLILRGSIQGRQENFDQIALLPFNSGNWECDGFQYAADVVNDFFKRHCVLGGGGLAPKTSDGEPPVELLGAATDAPVVPPTPEHEPDVARLLGKDERAAPGTEDSGLRDAGATRL